jgi:mediator of RNA polymerase II transcription subunit 10
MARLKNGRAARDRQVEISGSFSSSAIPHREPHARGLAKGQRCQPQPQPASFEGITSSARDTARPVERHGHDHTVVHVPSFVTLRVTSYKLRQLILGRSAITEKKITLKIRPDRLRKQLEQNESRNGYQAQHRLRGEGVYVKGAGKVEMGPAQEKSPDEVLDGEGCPNNHNTSTDSQSRSSQRCDPESLRGGEHHSWIPSRIARSSSRDEVRRVKPSSSVDVLIITQLAGSINLIHSLASLSSLTADDSTHPAAAAIRSVLIPPEVIDYVSNGRNPDIYTREFVENVQRGNQVLNGKMQAFGSFAEIYARETKAAIPELAGDVDRYMEFSGGFEREEGEGVAGDWKMKTQMMMQGQEQTRTLQQIELQTNVQDPSQQQAEIRSQDQPQAQPQQQNERQTEDQPLQQSQDQAQQQNEGQPQQNPTS